MTLGPMTTEQMRETLDQYYRNLSAEPSLVLNPYDNPGYCVVPQPQPADQRVEALEKRIVAQSKKIESLLQRIAVLVDKLAEYDCPPNVEPTDGEQIMRAIRAFK